MARDELLPADDARLVTRVEAEDEEVLSASLPGCWLATLRRSSVSCSSCATAATLPELRALRSLLGLLLLPVLTLAGLATRLCHWTAPASGFEKGQFMPSEAVNIVRLIPRACATKCRLLRFSNGRQLKCDPNAQWGVTYPNHILNF